MQSPVTGQPRGDKAVSGSSNAPARWRFGRAEWREVGTLYVVIALLHIVGWGTCLGYAAQHPAVVGSGLAAYLFGLRHAFDADHIAAVDDTVRYMVQNGRNPLGVGFFFSLGHSTIVLIVCVGVALAAAAFGTALAPMREVGSVIGGAVSGTFLVLVGLLNLRILLDIARAWRHRRSGSHGHADIDAMMARRGLLGRMLRGRLANVVTRSWQMYPVGVLLGLSFDTAWEIGLLALATGASVASLPLGAVLSLPILFAAGMSAVDTTDGVFMCKAYRWALLEPGRKLVYNLATTALSVAVALLIGGVELAQSAVGSLHAEGQMAQAVRNVDFSSLGYPLVTVFMIGWGVSFLARQLSRLRSRVPGEQAP